jgi:hypothetical protein
VKNQILMAMTVAVTLISSVVKADTLKLDYRPDLYSGANGGGEFQAYDLSSGFNFANTQSAPPNLGLRDNIPTFQTFCVEYSFHFTPNAMYFSTPGYSLASQPSFNLADGHHGGVAYLYDQFWKGSLSAYNYTLGVGRHNSATDLQEAIWKLVADPSWANASLSGQALTYYNLGVAHNSDSIGNVRILELYSSYNNGVFSGDKQDQLVEVVPPPSPVPLPATASIGLGLLGTLGLVHLGRRRFTIA